MSYYDPDLKKLWFPDIRNEPKDLPLDCADFRDIQRSYWLYIDKTDLICRLIADHRFVYLARPGLFGKTLLLSTIEALFSGEASLFEGLAAEKLWKEESRPVVRIGFERIEYCNWADFLPRFDELLITAFGKAGFKHDWESDESVLAQLEDWLSEAGDASLVILVDDYDALFNRHLHSDAAFRLTDWALSQFFSILGRHSDKIRFLLVTGTVTHRNTGVFTAFPAMEDISLEPEFATLLGFTPEELDRFLGDRLDYGCRFSNDTRESLIDKIRRSYGGFRFSRDADSEVIQPFSLLHFAEEPECGLDPYWIRPHCEYVDGILRFCPKLPELSDEVRRISVFELTARQSSEPLSQGALLTQFGILTIKAVDDGMLELGFPSTEVTDFLREFHRLPAFYKRADR